MQLLEINYQGKIMAQGELSVNQVLTDYGLANIENKELQLDFSMNSISTLVQVQKFDRLVILNLSFNQFENIECLGQCTSIRELNISHNRIRSLSMGCKYKGDEACLGKCKELEKLDFGHNLIQFLLPSALEANKKLKIIIANDNCLTSVLAFTKHFMLIELDISNNKLTSKSLKYFASFKNVTNLSIAGNPQLFHVDCDNSKKKQQRTKLQSSASEISFMLQRDMPCLIQLDGQQIVRQEKAKAQHLQNKKLQDPNPKMISSFLNCSAISLKTDPTDNQPLMMEPDPLIQCIGDENEIMPFNKPKLIVKDNKGNAHQTKVIHRLPPKIPFLNLNDLALGKNENVDHRRNTNSNTSRDSTEAAQKQLRIQVLSSRQSTDRNMTSQVEYLEMQIKLKEDVLFSQQIEHHRKMAGLKAKLQNNYLTLNFSSAIPIEEGKVYIDCIL